ncbi:hypothetical protein TARUN_4636 [Trichoderma arundinaceum]|uniref:Uncharacterized protein n=1 Tax=Trichoderma arundinaceum TaxID=490622 RepID=A0A395NND7_TRIAR|nr:hypothetical protein TARUN_4636 [Trichoderma arundinaceum]
MGGAVAVSETQRPRYVLAARTAPAKAKPGQHAIVVQIPNGFPSASGRTFLLDHVTFVPIPKSPMEDCRDPHFLFF